MPILTVHHHSAYRYASPVSFGEHRLMIRPRDSHDLRLIDTALVIRPAAQVRWLHDVFGNSVAIATFEQAATELVIDSTFRAEQYPTAEREIVPEPYARTWPFNYSPEDRVDLGPSLSRGYPDPWGKVDTWARWFVEPGRNLDAVEILTAMTRSIQYQFAYARRDAMGTQTPIETLESRSGNCRDFALFMMEAARSLGFAAQFVSGYLYDEPASRAAPGFVGGAATHAWVQVHLPGAGWVEFDPTNGLVGGRNLIRVAVVRDPSQAIPLSGTWHGRPGDFLGMTVDVRVTAE